MLYIERKHWAERRGQTSVLQLTTKSSCDPNRDAAKRAFGIVMALLSSHRAPLFLGIERRGEARNLLFSSPIPHPIGEPSISPAEEYEPWRTKESTGDPKSEVSTLVRSFLRYLKTNSSQSVPLNSLALYACTFCGEITRRCASPYGLLRRGQQRKMGDSTREQSEKSPEAVRRSSRTSDDELAKGGEKAK